MGQTRYGVRDEIKQTADDFYRAVSKKNLAAIDALWAHEKYATVAGRSGEMRVGWPAVRGYWELRFNQLGETIVRAQLRNWVCHAVGDVAWISGTEIRSVTTDGMNRQEDLRMTCVMERKGMNWQIVSYHASEPAANTRSPQATAEEVSAGGERARSYESAQ